MISVSGSSDAESTSGEDSDESADPNQDFAKHLDCEALRPKINVTPSATKRIVSRRNCVIKELINEHRTSILLVVTEDLILEYCTDKKKIMDIIFIDTSKAPNDDSFHSQMRRRNKENWPDDTSNIKREHGENIKDDILTAITSLMRFLNMA